MKPSNGDIALQNYIDEQLGKRQVDNVFLHPSALQTALKTTSPQRASRTGQLLAAFFILFTIFAVYFLSANKISESERQPLAINAHDPVLATIAPRTLKATSASIPFVVRPSNHERLPLHQELPKSVIVKTTKETKTVNEKSQQSIDESTSLAIVSSKANLTELSQQLSNGNIDAIARLNSLYQKSPHDPAIFMLWLKHSIAIDFNSSVSQAKTWLQENEGNPAIAQFTAESLLRGGRASEAIAVLKEQAKRAPLSFEARLIEALAWQKNGDHMSAIQRFNLLLLQVPEHSHLHAAIAISLSAVGLKNDAILHWQVALRDTNLPIALREIAHSSALVMP